MCCIYFAFTNNITEYILSKHLLLLPEHLKKRLSNLADNTSRTNSHVGMMIVNEALADQQSGIDISNLHYLDNGKPSLPDSHCVSIAHSGNVVLCAYSSTGKVGVDVEHLKNMSSLHYEDYLTPNEITAVNTEQSPKNAFGRMWVRKEAILKADGIGLLHPLNELEVTLATAQLHKNTYYLHDINIAPGYVAALATTQPHTIVTVKEVYF